MSRHKFTRRKKNNRLALENLEARQMMAADLDPMEIRSYDGTGNNLENTEWGSTNEQLIRFAESEYADGISEPGGGDRPSAREISNAIAAHSEDAGLSERDLSAFIYVWGQFLDHDIDLTQSGDTEAFNIEVPTGDAYFDPDGSGDDVISMFRSLFDPTTGVDSPREQITEITSWIDGSGVYGSSEEVANSLRTFEGGHLLTSDADLLPTDAGGFFMAGDIRANENIELTALHTLFMREHNRLADQISARNPELSDEEIFQRARSMVIAEIQSITFNEFLPALLGQNAISTYSGYDPTVNPSIANEFSTAAYRLGHSMINEDIEFFGNDGRAVRDEVELRDAFFNPGLLQETGIDSVLKYAASSVSQEIDSQIVDSLRNFLFGAPGQGGLDLASLNIQRGRDHGLADYNDTREAYGLERIDSFDDITSNPELAAKLEELYGTVDNVDLWVGLLAEDHVPGSSVGELTQTILVDQFERLRDGDRFWYQNVFSGRELDRIEHTTLSDIIERNTTVEGLQRNVFVFQAQVNGHVVQDTVSRDGRMRPQGVPGVTVELLNDEGEVVASTLTDERGQFLFTEFDETGDYQIRIVAPEGTAVRGDEIQDVLISSGDVRLRPVDFALVSLSGGGGNGGHDHDHHGPGPGRPPRPGSGPIGSGLDEESLNDGPNRDRRRR